MVKHFRVPGSLRLRLEEAGVLVPAVLRRAGLPQNLFEQTRILVSTDELFALWRAIGEAGKDPSAGDGNQHRPLSSDGHRGSLYGELRRSD